jgi:hypothetical protein
MYIEQAPAVDLRRFPNSRDFSVATLDTTAITGLNSSISLECRVLTSWGSRTDVLPWRTNIEPHPNSLNFKLSALFVLRSGDNFIVGFGFKSSKLWCCVTLGDELNNPSPLNPFICDQSDQLDYWWKYQKSVVGVPEVLVDRASKKLKMDDRAVNVSIRKVASGLAVNVSTSEPNYARQPVFTTEANA